MNSITSASTLYAVCEAQLSPKKIYNIASRIKRMPRNAEKLNKNSIAAQRSHQNGQDDVPLLSADDPFRKVLVTFSSGASSMDKCCTAADHDRIHKYPERLYQSGFDRLVTFCTAAAHGADPNLLHWKTVHV